MIATLVAASLLLIGLGALEAAVHAHRVGRIPIRIHVNGTRGKSSVTRLIAAGLRGGGVRTFAKTTGSAASMILPDGSEEPIDRPANPNIIEQRRVVHAAAGASAEALVLECMALQPLLQSLCELRLIRSNLGVITNVRPDHLEVMGPQERDVARALAGTTPVGGRLFTCESRSLDVLQASAEDRRSTLVDIGRDEIEAIGPAELDGFSHVEHPENVALALAVCEALGVPRRVALESMWAARPDPGALTLLQLHSRTGYPLYFADGFAANDVESSRRVWELALARHPESTRRIAVFNCRQDRPERSKALAESCADWPRADWYVLMGSGTHLFARTAEAAGIAPEALRVCERQPPEAVLELLLQRVDGPTVVVGLGNTKGGGLALAELLDRRRRAERES
jgi:poly-gamma-glutamate synthase PgsB/CapB